MTRALFENFNKITKNDSFYRKYNAVFVKVDMEWYKHLLVL